MLTEQQRLQAIESCDRIQVLLDRQDQAFKNIIRIFDNAANKRDPNDGVVPLSPEA